MSDKLFSKAYSILDDSSKPEEDRVDEIEALARFSFPGLSSDEVERLVLDILMAHHRGKDPIEAARSQRIGVSSNQQSRNPRSLPAPRAKASGNLPDQVSVTSETPAVQGASAAPQGGISLDSTFAPNLKPFDQLRNLLGWNNTDEDIERALAHNDYDLERTISMLSGEQMPVEMSKEQLASRIMCRYYINGNCARGSQCMYSHDGSTRLCRFWLHQRCFIGPECIFLHEIPKSTVNRVAQLHTAQQQPTSSLEDLPTLGSLPSLGSKPSKKSKNATKNLNALGTPDSAGSPFLLGKSLASLQPVSEVMATNRGRVPLVAPRLTPWKATRFGNNEEYINLRKRAAAHAEQRNKLLQRSTAAWSTNDSALAKKLSDKGRGEEQKMIELSRKAADILWGQKSLASSEIWLDLHSLDLADAVALLEEKLGEVAATDKHSPRVMYVVTGRGHFKAKKYADFLSQYVALFLDSAGYKHRDFGVDAEFGRVTAIDPWSRMGDKS